MTKEEHAQFIVDVLVGEPFSEAAAEARKVISARYQELRIMNGFFNAMRTAKREWLTRYLTEEVSGD